MARTICIFGASTRAAAFSALRAGLAPACADLFADRDLAARCRVVRVRRYPSGLLPAARALPAGPWMYTGALENYPALVGRLLCERPLWGNTSEVLRRVRDPMAVAECLRRAGLPYAKVQRSSNGLPSDGSWLCKPLRSAGGVSVRPWYGPGHVGAQVRSASAVPEARFLREAGLLSATGDDCFFQQRLEGVPCAAVYVADGAKARFVAATRQLVGEPAFGARGFTYCGSVGPLTLPHETERQMQQLGDVLAGEFGLVGLFGIDGILTEERGDERGPSPAQAADPGVASVNSPLSTLDARLAFRPVEVNPRYTASIEVLEMALGWSALESHVRACRDRELHMSTKRRPLILPSPLRGKGRGEGEIGKAVLYAPRTVGVPDLMPLAGPRSAASRRNWGRERHFELDALRAADIPRAGSMIRAGRPILTLFARGADPSTELRARAEEVFSRLGVVREHRQGQESGIAGAARHADSRILTPDS